MGELQFFVPGVDLELFEGSRSGRGVDQLRDDNRLRRFRPFNGASEVQFPLAVQPGFAEFSGGQIPADAERD